MSFVCCARSWLHAGDEQRDDGEHSLRALERSRHHHPLCAKPAESDRARPRGVEQRADQQFLDHRVGDPFCAGQLGIRRRGKLGGQRRVEPRDRPPLHRGSRAWDAARDELRAQHRGHRPGDGHGAAARSGLVAHVDGQLPARLRGERHRRTERDAVPGAGPLWHGHRRLAWRAQPADRHVLPHDPDRAAPGEGGRQPDGRASHRLRKHDAHAGWNVLHARSGWRGCRAGGSRAHLPRDGVIRRGRYILHHHLRHVRSVQRRHRLTLRDAHAPGHLRRDPYGVLCGADDSPGRQRPGAVPGAHSGRHCEQPARRALQSAPGEPGPGERHRQVLFGDLPGRQRL